MQKDNLICFPLQDSKLDDKYKKEKAIKVNLTPDKNDFRFLTDNELDRFYWMQQK